MILPAPQEPSSSVAMLTGHPAQQGVLLGGAHTHRARFLVRVLAPHLQAVLPNTSYFTPLYLSSFAQWRKRQLLLHLRLRELSKLLHIKSLPAPGGYGGLSVKGSLWSKSW